MKNEKIRRIVRSVIENKQIYNVDYKASEDPFVEMSIRKMPKIKYGTLASTGLENYRAGTGKYDTKDAQNVSLQLEKINWSEGDAFKLIQYIIKNAKKWANQKIGQKFRDPSVDEPTIARAKNLGWSSGDNIIVTRKDKAEFGNPFRSAYFKRAKILDIALRTSLVKTVNLQGIESKKNSLCFLNSYNVSVEYGFSSVIGIIRKKDDDFLERMTELFPHAWNMDKNGNHIDSTLGGVIELVYYPGKIIDNPPNESFLANSAWDFMNACDVAVTRYLKSDLFKKNIQNLLSVV